MTISENFEHFRYFNFETDFLEKENFLEKNWRTVFELNALSLKRHHFHLPMVRQIEWELQNGPITENRVLPVTNLFF